MIKLTIRELIDLVASEVPAPEIRVEKVFEWAHRRRLELAKWILAIAGALFVPVAIAFLRGELGKSTSGWWLLGAVFGAVLMAMFGLGLLFQARQVHRTYIAAQALLGEIQKIAPFIRRYRQRIDKQWRR